MARRRTLAPATLAVATTVRRMSDYEMDAPKSDLGPKFGHIRDGQIFLSVGLTRYMEAKWGAFTAVTTSTDKKASTVTVFRADPDVGQPVPVNRYGTMNAAVFSFFVPLQELNLNPGKDRQFEVVPYEQPIEDGPVAFVFEMEKRVSLPRNRQEEESGSGAAKQPSGSATENAPAATNESAD